MSSTNKTTNLELSQFLGSDSPKWLTDYNADMEKIDTGYQTVKAQADATDLVVGGHTSSISTLQDTTTSQGTAISGLRTDVTANSGSINTINSLIGNGEPTTTDKTIIGAINELAAEITPGGSVTASSVSYTNTTSGLTATDVQAAIDELKDDIDSIPTTSSAANVSYNNATSGLTATNVQAAIDEVAQASDYTLAGSQTGTNTISISATAKEFIVVVKNVIGPPAGYVTLNLLRVIGSGAFFAGSYDGTTSGVGVKITADFENNTIKLDRLHNDGTDDTSKTTIYVYQK